MTNEEGLFPLVDRRAPFLDRIRSNGEGLDGESFSLGEIIAESVKTGEGEDFEKGLKSFLSETRSDIAESLGVSEDAVDEDFIKSAYETIKSVDENTVISHEELEDMGLAESEPDDNDDWLNGSDDEGSDE